MSKQLTRRQWWARFICADDDRILKSLGVKIKAKSRPGNVYYKIADEIIARNIERGNRMLIRRKK